MKHEIKIIMTYEDENIDSDGRALNTPKLYVDGYAIGGVQKISFQALSKNIIPQLEIVFPDLHNHNIDPLYHSTKHPLSMDVDYYINKLSQVPNIQIKLQDIDDGTSNIIGLTELGTNGFIESIPMKRRYK